MDQGKDLAVEDRTMYLQKPDVDGNHINTGSGTGCIEGYGGIYPDGNGVRSIYMSI